MSGPLDVCLDSDWLASGGLARGAGAWGDSLGGAREGAAQLFCSLFSLFSSSRSARRSFSGRAFVSFLSLGGEDDEDDDEEEEELEEEEDDDEDRRGGGTSLSSFSLSCSPSLCRLLSPSLPLESERLVLLLCGGDSERRALRTNRKRPISQIHTRSTGLNSHREENRHRDLIS